MGLGKIAEGGSGHYEWFDLKNWTEKEPLADENDASFLVGETLLISNFRELVSLRSGNLSDRTQWAPREESAPVKPSVAQKAKPNKAADRGTPVAKEALPKVEKLAVKVEEKVKPVAPNSKEDQVMPKQAKPRDLSPIKAQMVRIEDAWLSGTIKIVLVDLNFVHAGIGDEELRIEMLITLSKQADYFFLSGNPSAIAASRAKLSQANISATTTKDTIMTNKYLLGEANKIEESDNLQFLVFSNAHSFSQLATRGHLTVVTPDVGYLSRVLGNNAQAVVDLSQGEGKVRAQKEKPVNPEKEYDKIQKLKKQAKKKAHLRSKKKRKALALAKR